MITDTTAKTGAVTDPQLDEPVGQGIDEDDFDKQFFSKHMSKDQLSKLKLNKGEKRALKFLLKKTGDLASGEQIDL